VKIIFAPAAIVDLQEISDYIAADNPERAATFVAELIDHCYALGEMPRRFPLIPRYEHWGIRRCVCGNYLIFYRVRDEAIDIVHVLHGARDYESLLFPDA